MRRATILLLLALAGISLASCGKGSLTRTVTLQSATAASTAGTTSTPASTTPTPTTPPSGTTPPSSTSPAPGKTPAPGTTPSPSAPSASQKSAAAFARAVNLTSDDVPGFTPSEKHDSNSNHEKRLERAMLRCAGVGSNSKGVLEEGSKDFQLKRQIIDFSVSSEVSVQSSAAEALHGLAAIRSPKVRSCFSRYLTLIFKGEQVKGATAGPVKIQAGTPPAPGTSGGFGWRVTATFTVHGVKLPIYLDFLGFVDGPAEVTLLSSGLLRPFPASVQQHLFSLLLTRAKAHKL